jgi:hypothetical protein
MISGGPQLPSAQISVEDARAFEGAEAGLRSLAKRRCARFACAGVPMSDSGDWSRLRHQLG